MKGYTYILLCSDGSFYTGSTKYFDLRMQQHFSGKGANHTRKHPPVKVLYVEEHQHIGVAFYREKQIQGWSRKKKKALINGNENLLREFAICKNDTHCSNKEPFGFGFDSAQPAANEP